MRGLVPALLAGVLAASGSPAVAACGSAGQASAKALPIEEPAVGAPFFVHLGVWLSVLKERGVEPGGQTADARCVRARFRAAGRAYALRAAEEEGALPRLALAGAKGAPLAYLLPVPDLTAALAAGRSGPAPLAGYALMTAQAGAHTAWRAYDAVPVDAVLVRDMAEALSGRTRPVMRWQDGQITIIVPRAAPDE